MVATLNYDAQKGFRELYQEDRWGVLSVLILHSNGSGRSWPSTKRIMNQLDRSSSIITRARQWLLDHEAIRLVPYDKRQGDELKLPKRQYIYELTGKVKLGNRYIPYLYIQEPKVESSDDPNDIDCEVSDSEHSDSETFRIRNLTVSNTEESNSSNSTDSFFAKIAKQDGYALYLFNEKDKLLCTVAFKSLLDLPGNTHDWTSIIGSQIDVKRFGEYTLTDVVPTPAKYQPPLKEESEPTPPGSAAPPAPIEPPSETKQLPEPTVPSGYEWWFSGDKANERHLLWIGKGRPLCGIKSWRNTNKWSASLQGHVPCAACVQIANSPKPALPTFTNEEKNEMAVLCYGSVDAWTDKRYASAMMGALKRVKALTPGMNDQTLKAFGRDWDANDFRGKKGQRPKPHQVADEWMGFKERVQTEVVNGGHTGNSEPRKSAILW